MIKYSDMVNHYTHLNLTKLDILDEFKEIPVAVEYRLEGEILESFPADLKKLERVEVIYKTLPGWNTPTTGAKTFQDLPENAREYVNFIQDFVGVKIKYIGTGPAREDMIMIGDEENRLRKE